MSKNKSENRSVASTKNRKLLVRKLENNMWFFLYMIIVILTVNILHKILWALEILTETTFIMFGVMIVISLLFVAFSVNRNNDTESFR